MLRGRQASLAASADEEKILFLALNCFGCRQSFSKVFTCILVENHTYIPMVKLKSVSGMRTCNVWAISIPTFMMHSSSKGVLHCHMVENCTCDYSCVCAIAMAKMAAGNLTE